MLLVSIQASSLKCSLPHLSMGGKSYMCYIDSWIPFQPSMVLSVPDFQTWLSLGRHLGWTGFFIFADLSWGHRCFLLLQMDTENPNHGHQFQNPVGSAFSWGQREGHFHILLVCHPRCQTTSPRCLKCAISFSERVEDSIRYFRLWFRDAFFDVRLCM